MWGRMGRLGGDTKPTYLTKPHHAINRRGDSQVSPLLSYIVIVMNPVGTQGCIAFTKAVVLFSSI